MRAAAFPGGRRSGARSSDSPSTGAPSSITANAAVATISAATGIAFRFRNGITSKNPVPRIATATRTGQYAAAATG